MFYFSRASFGLFALALISYSSVAVADFKFSDGKCTNEKGEVGLNPGVIGDCGDLRNLDLRTSVLAAKSLRGARLDGANLSGVNLSGTSFVSSSFVKAKASGSVLTGTDFTDAKLDSIDLSAATGVKPHFVRASGTGIFLKSAELSGSDFSGASLVRAVLDNGSFPESIFSNTDLSETTAVSTNLTRTQFLNSNLFSMNLTKANFTDAQATLADFSFAILSSANLSGVRFSGITFFQTDLSAATGEKPTILLSKATETDFSRSIFSGANFSGFEIVDSKLEHAIWKEANLEKALFRSDRLGAADFEKANFRAARMENCIIGSASFLETDFRMTRLQESGWEKAILTGAKINRSTIHPFSDAEITRLGINKTVRKKEMGILVDGRYVDMGSESRSEGTNLRKILSDAIVVKTEKFTPENFAIDLDAVGTYVIPELEEDDLPTDERMVSTLQTFLGDGGNLILFSESDLSLIRAVTGATVSTSNLSTYPVNDPLAKSLGLNKLPTSVKREDATDGLLLSSLPMGSQALYGTADVGAVVMIPMYSGVIWYFGWDFFDYQAEEDMKNWSKVLSTVVKRAAE